MMGETAMAAHRPCVRSWRHMTVLSLLFATILSHTLATTIPPTSQRMSVSSEVVMTVSPSELNNQTASVDGPESTNRTTLSNIPSSTVTPTTQKTTSMSVGDEFTTLLPSTKMTSQSQHATTFPSRTTSLSTHSATSAMPTFATTNIQTVTLSSTSVGSSTTLRSSSRTELSTTLESSTPVESSTSLGSSTSMGIETTLAISITKQQTSEEPVSDITVVVTEGTTSGRGGGSGGEKLSVVQWFLIAVALAALIFFLFICYHFCQVKKSKKDQTFASHNKNFIEYATPQSPKEKWRNSWALEAMIYHIELPQENSAEMEAKVNTVFEEDETDAPSDSNHTRPHLTKL